jgi:hypothetical protein
MLHPLPAPAHDPAPDLSAERYERIRIMIRITSRKERSAEAALN